MADYEKLLKTFEFCTADDKRATVIAHIGPIIRAWNDLYRVDGFPRLWQECHDELRRRAQAIAATADKERHERAKNAILKNCHGEDGLLSEYLGGIDASIYRDEGIAPAAEEALYHAARYFAHTGGQYEKVIDAAILLTVATNRPI